jgi:pyruvate dehydrogenase E2 component (dihydrolipoamide acetyltransferase)
MERSFAMPDLGEGLEEGEVVQWLVAEGSTVELNQPLVEVETAKATVEIPSPFAGRISVIHAKEGDVVPVGVPLVTFEVEERSSEAAGAAGATPAVRRLAKDLGVDLSSVEGTGPRGRVLAEDVQASHDAATSEVDRVPVTAIRRAIADRLTDAAAIPQVTTFRSIDCTALEEVRGELGLSPLPLVVRALATACLAHPLLNARWTEDAIEVSTRVHVGIATDTERGLVVPVLRDAVGASALEVAAEIARLAEAARSGSLRPEELRGATIAVSNTGSYGGEFGTPILVPGTAVTLALGVIEPKATVVDEGIAVRPGCTLSVTFDHRVLDGAAVGRALSDLIEVLESAVRMRELG